MTIRGDENGYKVFKMFAQITGIEWQLIQTGVEGDNGLNFLGTSHQELESSAGDYLYKISCSMDIQFEMTTIIIHGIVQIHHLMT